MDRDTIDKMFDELYAVQEDADAPYVESLRAAFNWYGLEDMPREEFIEEIYRLEQLQDDFKFAYKMETLLKRVDEKEGKDVVSQDDVDKLMDMLQEEYYNQVEPIVCNFFDYSREDYEQGLQSPLLGMSK